MKNDFDEIKFIFISLIILSLGACIEGNNQAFMFITVIHSIMLYVSLYTETSFSKRILSLF